MADGRLALAGYLATSISTLEHMVRKKPIHILLLFSCLSGGIIPLLHLPVEIKVIRIKIKGIILVLPLHLDIFVINSLV